MIKKIWIAPYIKTKKDLSGNKVDVFGEPFEIQTSINTLSGSTDMEMFGDRVKRMCKAMPNYNMIDKIHEKDVAYLFGATPEGEVVNGENANYRVDSILPQNVKVKIYFEKMVDS